MPESRGSERRSVPARALVLSLGALAVPVTGALGFPEALGEYGALLWLVALVPAFLLAYYRGWRGVATALAAGMATLSLTQAVALWLDRSVPDLLLGVVVAYLAIAMGLGWVTEILHREKEEVEGLAFTDLLTGLPNRRHAQVFLENEFAAAERGRLLSIVLFDLDAFKEYNDRYGHQAGDEALQAFADVLARTTRRMNLCARFGGEEFLAVLAGSDTEGARIFADRVRSALQGRRLGDGPLTVSGGVATYHPSMRSTDELVAAADHALYQAKREGRNRVRVFGRTRAEQSEGDRPRQPEDRSDIASPAPRQPGRPPNTRAEEGDAGTVTLLPHRITSFGSGRSVLIVEDDEQVRSLISTYLQREGFDVSEGGDVIEGVRLLRDEYEVVITDINLPGASGHELVAAVKSRWPATQVIVITGLQDAQFAAQALNAGADRYLFKPFGMPELRAHLVDALARYDRTKRDREERRELGRAARERAEEARDAVLRGTRALVRAVEVRDPYTRGHADRVAEYARVLAEGMEGATALLDVPSLTLGCHLHDVGKIGVPDAILNKEGPLEHDEFEQVKSHPDTGRRILEPLLEDDTALAVVSWHHERWDGRGYPDGLAGETIPLAARIVALADALDAMTNDRSYRPALTWEAAVAEIGELAEQQFDPDVVAVLGEVEPDLRAVFERTEESEERG